MHDALIGKMVAVFTNECVTGQGLTAFIKIVNVSADVCEAGLHFAVVAEIVPLSIDLLPARGENAIGEVAGHAVQLLPAGEHPAVIAKAVGFSADGLPAGHDAVAAKVPGNAVLFQPAGGGNAALKEKIPLPVYVQPAGDGFGVKVPIISHAVLFRPAAAIDLGVVYQPSGAGRKGEQLKNQHNR